jgi:MFS family permease
MQKNPIKVYGYRWAVLIAFMLITVLNQMLWITFAPITKDAAAFYGVTDLSIGLLSLVFMVVYLVVSIPASWAIDTWGIRIGVGIGAVLTGIFGILRGVWADNYSLVLIAQIGIAIGQPFILNAGTSVVARWFPVNERGTAVGLASLATYLGIFTGLVLSPILVLQQKIGGMLVLYGVAAMIGAILYLIFARGKPATAPCPPEMEVRSLVLDGLRKSFHIRDFVTLLIIFFIGLGIFNAVTTWIEDILRPHGFTSVQAGISGGVMIAGGIVGALIIPTLSDHFRRRVPFIMIALVGAAAGLIGITYAHSYWFLLTCSAMLGFFLLSSGPIGFQYGAEITYPTPEGTSNGLLLMMGQVSGIIFIIAMDAFKSPLTGSMSVPLYALIGLMVVALILSFRLKEPAILQPGPTTILAEEEAQPG